MIASGVPVSVRGFEWESLLLVGQSGVPQVVAMRWWGREKGVPGQQRQQQEALLRASIEGFGAGCVECIRFPGS